MGFATVIVSWCVLPHLCVSKKCIPRIKRVADASTFKDGRASSSDDASMTVVGRLETESVA